MEITNFGQDEEYLCQICRKIEYDVFRIEDERILFICQDCINTLKKLADKEELKNVAPDDTDRLDRTSEGGKDLLNCVSEEEDEKLTFKIETPDGIEIVIEEHQGIVYFIPTGTDLSIKVSQIELQVTHPVVTLGDLKHGECFEWKEAKFRKIKFKDYENLCEKQTGYCFRINGIEKVTRITLQEFANENN